MASELHLPKFQDIATCDRSTGEILKDSVLALLPKKKIQNGFGKGWFAMNQGALDAFIKSGLKGRDYEVLFSILKTLDFNNYIQLCQANICKELNMKAPHVTRSIKKLIEIGALKEGPKVGKSKTYILDCEFGWKGNAKNHHEAIRKKYVENIIPFKEFAKERENKNSNG